MIRHIVLFKYHDETSQADRDAFLAMLRELPSKIEEILEFEAAHDLVQAARSFDTALVATYADLDALDRYAKHEHHQPVVNRAKEICRQVVSVDYEIGTPTSSRHDIQ
ncbi:MAG: Dabb family protein [Acidobacteriota bacterium]|nr:MAG: Dabb family protein [Acidobacteriota bacterium]